MSGIIRRHQFPHPKVKRSEVPSLKYLCENQVCQIREKELENFPRNQTKDFSYLLPQEIVAYTEEGKKSVGKWHSILLGPVPFVHPCDEEIEDITHFKMKISHNPNSLFNTALKSIITYPKIFNKICKMTLPFVIRRELIEWKLLLISSLRFQFYRLGPLDVAMSGRMSHERCYIMYQLLDIWGKSTKQYNCLSEDVLAFLYGNYLCVLDEYVSVV